MMTGWCKRVPSHVRKPWYIYIHKDTYTYIIYI
jgi:hypothetical protein